MILEGNRFAERIAVGPMTAERRDVGPVLIGNDPYIHLGDGAGSTHCGRAWTNDYRNERSGITCTACHAYESGSIRP